MRDKNFQGLIRKDYSNNESFIKSIVNKKSVYIATQMLLTMNVINYCQNNPDLNLFVSKHLFMLSNMALAFKLDFDQKIINQINKM